MVTFRGAMHKKCQTSALRSSKVINSAMTVIPLWLHRQKGPCIFQYKINIITWAMTNILKLQNGSYETDLSSPYFTRICKGELKENMGILHPCQKCLPPLFQSSAHSKRSCSPHQPCFQGPGTPGAAGQAAQRKK